MFKAYTNYFSQILKEICKPRFRPYSLPNNSTFNRQSIVCTKRGGDIANLS